jgi:hypothetical protein
MRPPGERIGSRPWPTTLGHEGEGRKPILFGEAKHNADGSRGNTGPV